MHRTLICSGSIPLASPTHLRELVASATPAETQSTVRPQRGLTQLWQRTFDLVNRSPFSFAGRSSIFSITQTLQPSPAQTSRVVFTVVSAQPVTHARCNLGRSSF